MMYVPEISRRIRRSGTVKGRAKLGYKISRGEIIFKNITSKITVDPTSKELSEASKKKLRAALEAIKRSTEIPKDALSRRY